MIQGQVSLYKEKRFQNPKHTKGKEVGSFMVFGEETLFYCFNNSIVYSTTLLVWLGVLYTINQKFFLSSWSSNKVFTHLIRSLKSHRKTHKLTVVTAASMRENCLVHFSSLFSLSNLLFNMINNSKTCLVKTVWSNKIFILKNTYGLHWAHCIISLHMVI